jgi:hypothetical protein
MIIGEVITGFDLCAGAGFGIHAISWNWLRAAVYKGCTQTCDAQAVRWEVLIVTFVPGFVPG